MELHHTLHGCIRFLRMPLRSQCPSEQIVRPSVLRVHVYGLAEQAHGRRGIVLLKVRFPHVEIGGPGVRGHGLRFFKIGQTLRIAL